MRHLRKSATIVAAALAGVGVVSGGIIACSSDDTVVTTDGGADTGPDVQTDTQTPPPPPPPGDAGKDVIVVEASTLADFLTQNAAATCIRYKECCAGVTDAGFDLARCNTDFSGTGWDQSITAVNATGVTDGGRIAFDPAAATDCLTGVRNMTCKNTTAAEFRGVWEKCFAAVNGTSPVNGPCRNDVECVKTAYCDTSVDGGACRALLGSGAACKPGDPPFLGSQCSYRGTGTVGCEPQGDASACGPALANGSTCNYDFDCVSGACSPVFDDAGNVTNGACSNKADFLYGICDFYAADAGP